MLPRPYFLLPLVLLAACSGKTDAGDKQDDTSGTEDHALCPVAVVDPHALDFTELVIGASASGTVSLLNNCVGSTTALTIQASVNDAAFTVDPPLSSVAPGEVATLSVTAVVADYAEAAGALVLVTNDSASPLVTISLTAVADPDQDGDGSEAIEAGGDDCDDEDPTASPGAQEIWYDGVDQDCDGNDDDQDGDGATADIDCDDTDPTVFPGATETWYDGIDSDCASDDDFDQDGDGYDAYEDCDDLDSAINPAATEICDLGDVDENCSGTADDADASADTTGMTTFYADADGDGFGGASTPLLRCDLPASASAVAGDCDDSDATVNPLAAEVCDASNVDEDCDGFADDADASVDVAGYATFYADSDADGFGDASATILACDQPVAYSADGTDCDDGDPNISPEVREICGDGVDQDCDGADGCDSPCDSAEAALTTTLDSAGNADVSLFCDGADLPAGVYQVSYVSGAVNYGTDLNPTGGWCVNRDLVCENCDGTEPYADIGAWVKYDGGSTEASAPGDDADHASQADVEVASAGLYIQFDHAGGTIGVEFHDWYYGDNADGSPNPTFELAFVE